MKVPDGTLQTLAGEACGDLPLGLHGGVSGGVFGFAEGLDRK